MKRKVLVGFAGVVSGGWGLRPDPTVADENDIDVGMDGLAAFNDKYVKVTIEETEMPDEARVALKEYRRRLRAWKKAKQEAGDDYDDLD